MKAWKKAEARVAEKFGTRRAPLSGSNGGVTASDTLSESIFAEVKYRRRHAWVTCFYEVEEAAKKELRINSNLEREAKFPALVLAEKGRHRLFAVCPLESGYLFTLANEVRKHEIEAEHRKAKEQIIHTDHTEDA